MRFLNLLLLSSVLILVAGCSAPATTSPLALTSNATPSFPVETKRDAIAVGNQILEEKGGIMWLETPEAVLVEEMSYVESIHWIGLDDAQYDHWPRETRVWLVVFKGRWQLVPLDPSQANPTPITYDGCGFVLFTASNGEFMAMGDAVCPTR